MEFYVDKVFMSLSADDVKIGSKGYCADDDNCGHCNKICICIGTLPIKFKELYENYTYLDGTPCGIKEEEENEND